MHLSDANSNDAIPDSGEYLANMSQVFEILFDSIQNRPTDDDKLLEDIMKTGTQLITLIYHDLILVQGQINLQC
jgi:hypothetical protein